jgi:Caspase domain
MKNFLRCLLFTLMVGSVYAQNNLPICTGDISKWSNCFGSSRLANGNFYMGEFKDGNANGKGTLLSSYGSFINYGLWDNGVFVGSSPIQPLQQATAPTTEIERLRSEAALERKQRQELEEQLRLAQQQPQTTTPTASAPSMGKRVALVVGNANYKVRPLKNPRNDADDISRSLRSSGFEVIDLRDASLQQMRNGVRQFGDRLINNDVGLVYYSGHGVEVKGRNYFIPVNADIMREDEIADQGLDVSLILEKMNTAGKGVNILIVDACRDDPFGRSFRSSSRGLAQMDAPRGTIIAYATSPGKVAADGDGRNSPYTKNLVKAMQQPNKPIEQVFKEVRRAVQEETKNQQTPWENTSLSGDFYFRVQR